MRTNTYENLLDDTESTFGVAIYSKAVSCDGCNNIDFQVKVEQYPDEPFVVDLCVQCSIDNVDWATIEDSKITITEADEGVYFNSERAGASWYRIKVYTTDNRCLIAYTKAKTERAHI